MLKIKDNVDLKELEKFGFEYHGIYDGIYHFAYHNDLDIEIIEDDREIYSNKNIDDENDLIFNKYSDLLYDLIKADLVEKVEDK